MLTYPFPRSNSASRCRLVAEHEFRCIFGYMTEQTPKADPSLAPQNVAYKVLMRFPANPGIEADHSLCPECGGRIARASGCAFCPACGGGKCG